MGGRDEFFGIRPRLVSESRRERIRGVLENAAGRREGAGTVFESAGTNGQRQCESWCFSLFPGLFLVSFAGAPRAEDQLFGRREGTRSNKNRHDQGSDADAARIIANHDELVDPRVDRVSSRHQSFRPSPRVFQTMPSDLSMSNRGMRLA